ncbi:MAG TPA: hypothetical protein VKB77_03000 [Terriglobales bacterium]|nr:hypothetical protein [Terriglobales bacterium]
MTAKGELCLRRLSDDGIFFLLFRSGAAFKERWNSDDSEAVGKNKHKISREEKEKAKEKNY